MAFLNAIAFLAALQADSAAVEPSTSEDIVVIGERLRRIRVAAKSDGKTGIRRCIVKRASGDPSLDRDFCDAVLICAESARKVADMRACIGPRVAEIARRRSGRTVRSD